MRQQRSRQGWHPARQPRRLPPTPCSAWVAKPQITMPVGPWSGARQPSSFSPCLPVCLLCGWGAARVAGGSREGCGGRMSCCASAWPPRFAPNNIGADRRAHESRRCRLGCVRLGPAPRKNDLTESFPRQLSCRSPEDLAKEAGTTLGDCRRAQPGPPNSPTGTGRPHQLRGTPARSATAARGPAGRGSCHPPPQHLPLVIPHTTTRPTSAPDAP
jgi:hypothetical protein